MPTLDGIDLHKFRSPVTINHLRQTKCEDIPQVPGVYIVLHPQKSRPVFLIMSTGGWFNGIDPSYKIEDMRRNWVKGATILYIGKAVGKKGLRQRIEQLVAFGAGKPVGHRGGRLIWHIKKSNKLLIRWRELPYGNPYRFESKLINQFKKVHGVRPFANLTK